MARPRAAASGSLCVDGWYATQYLPGQHERRRWAEIIAVGELFHAAVRAITRPRFLDQRSSPWAMGDRVAWGEIPASDFPHVRHLSQLAAALRPMTAPSQLIHGDLTGNVLFHERLAPAIIANVLDDERERRRAIFVLLGTAAVISVFAAIQFAAPASSPLNAYATTGGEEVATAVVASTGRSRVSSTFSFVSGFSDFSILIPTLIGALASIIVHLRDIQKEVLSLLQFLLGVEAPMSFELLRQILITIVLNTLLALPVYAVCRRVLLRYLPDDPRRRRRRAYTTGGLSPLSRA